VPASPRRPRNRAPGRSQLLLTCEHAGRRIPREYAALFRGRSRALASHRGFDPGALALARALARRLRRPLHAVPWSRLLVDANRSPANPRIWSATTARLPAEERERILARYWRPHRRAVEAAVGAAAARGRRVLHVAVHSFAPLLAGRVRRADVGLLYDPRRAGEKALCARFEQILRELDPTLQVRRNYPYRGAADGLASWLRRRFPERCYLGVELELNQALLARRRRHVERLLAHGLRVLLRPAGVLAVPHEPLLRPVEVYRGPLA
jgi:predicted N-formylglutamate amidohydrolase